MGLWDKLDKLKDRAQQELAERAARAALERSKAAARSAVKSAGKALGDALFGEEHEPASPPSAGASDRAAREAETGKKLREAAARQADREASDRSRLERERREAEVREARAKAAAKTEQEIEDELAALKKRIGK